MTRPADPTREPSFDQLYPALAALRPARKRQVAAFERVLAASRQFRREVVEPRALAIDRRVMSEPAYVATEVLEAAARYGYFSMNVPRVFGGPELPLGALMIGLEEVAAGCLGIANLISVHGLATCTVGATGDLAAIRRVCRLLVESEARGRPALLSTAITEPGAGTDAEDVDLLRTARLTSVAKPVRGGYLLNGRKVFISNGSIAHTHVVIMPTDRANPVDSTYAFLVEAGTKGLSVGRVERKMGQKACPAAELIFEDCFVPEAARISSQPLPGRRIDLILGATRGAVCVFGAGVARGAYERALAYARTHKLGGRWLLDHQWVQLRLADMLRNVSIARAAYVEAMLSNELFGLASILGGGGMERVPAALLQAAPVQRLVTSAPLRERSQRAVAALPGWMVDVSSAYGASAKVTGTDLGLANCHLALDIMGADGLRHDRGVEKLYRDAKLLQIYEGTNQLNRIELFKKGVAPMPVRRFAKTPAAGAAAPQPAAGAAQPAEPAPVPLARAARR